MFPHVLYAIVILAAQVVAQSSVLSRACSFVCPPIDNGGGTIFDQFLTATELVCEYGRGCSSCRYNKNTGTLDTDLDSGFCPVTAVSQCSRATRTVIFPHTPKSNDERRNHHRRTSLNVALAPRASSTCSYICPATDSSGNLLFDQFFFSLGAWSVPTGTEDVVFVIIALPLAK